MYNLLRLVNLPPLVEIHLVIMYIKLLLISFLLYYNN